MHGSVPGVMGVMVLVARRTVSCSSRSRRASSSPQVSHSGCCVALTSMISLKDFHVFLKRDRLPTGGRPLSIRESTKAWKRLSTCGTTEAAAVEGGGGGGGGSGGGGGGLYLLKCCTPLLTPPSSWCRLALHARSLLANISAHYLRNCVCV